MKNVLKIIIIFIVMFFSLNSVYAETMNDIKVGDAIEGVKLYLETPEREGYIKNMYKLENESTGELLYCVEPGVQLYNGSYKRLSNPYDITDITKEQYEMISRYAFFGYQYPGREDIKWYVVTQYLIWNYLLQDKGEVYFVDENEEKIEPYNTEIAELQDDVDKAYLVPSFAKNSNEVYDLRIGEVKTLTDELGVLHKFDKNRADGNPDYSIDGDQLTISFNYGGYYAFHFGKNSNTHGYAYVYFKDGSQVVISRGYINEPVSYAYFHVLYPSFSLQKKSSTPCDLSLAGAEYQIYYKNGDNLVGTYTTDEAGCLYVDELYSDQYYVVETKAPVGYKLNSDKVYFTVTNKNIELEMAEDPIIKEIKFQKYLENSDKVLNIEPDAEFQLFKKGNNVPIKTVTTDSQGMISFKLTYGNYILHQTKGTTGYSFMSDYEFTIDDNFLEGEAIKLTNPAITKAIKIVKYLNNYDGESIIEANANFELYNMATGLLQTVLTTDHLGEINLNLAYGTYKLHQIKGNEGYKFIDDYIFTIDDKTPNLYNIVLRNEQILKNIKITKYLTKYDKSNILEANAEFEIYLKDNHVLVKNIKTNNLGEANFNLPYGTYILHQTKGTSGFKFINDYEFIIDDTTLNGTNIVLYNPEIRKNIKIIKYLEDINSKVSVEVNAEFQVFDDQNNLIANLKTNNKGEAYLNDLSYGTYRIHQTKGTSGYAFINDYYLTIDDNTKEIISFYNKQIERNVKIIKYLENRDKSLKLEPDAEFQLLDAKTNKLIKELTTDSNGEINLELIYGTYILRQVKGTKGYSLAQDTLININDTTSEVIEIILKNKEIVKELKIVKYLENIDKSLNLEPDAEFKIIDKLTNKVIATIKTNDLGEAQITLGYGIYLIRQTKGTNGYYFMDDIEIVIDEDTPDILLKTIKDKQIIKNIKIIKYLINMDGTKLEEPNAKFELIDAISKKVVAKYSTNKKGEINIEIPYGRYILHQVKGEVGYYFIKDLNIFINDDTKDNEEIKLYNRQIIKEINIYKKKKNVDGSIDIEANATFQVYDKSSNKLIDTFTTDKEGHFKLVLPYGKYILHQIKGSMGYYFSKDKEIIINDETKFKDDLIIYNKQIEKQIIITKYLLESDQTLNLEPNAVFGLYKKDTKELIKKFTTNDEGMVKLNLTYGKYIIKQLSGKEGYLFSDDLEIIINDQTKFINNYDLYNKEITGTLKIKKKDALTLNLIDRKAQFKIRNKDTFEYLVIDNKNIWETINGYLIITNIPYGNYILEEVTPPYNYKILNNKEFSIKNDQETIELDVLNELMMGNIVIKKLDAITKKPLEGVIFGLYNSDKVLMGEYTTDSDGIIEIKDLEVGTYYIQELLTKDNYELNDEEIMVEVKDNITSYVTINNRQKISIPKTGSKEFLITIIVSTLILLIGTFICNYAKKNS